MVEDDLRWMQRALTLATRGIGRTTPNPVVGACVVTDEQVVVGDGAHERAGEPHAEVFALEEAGERARGATLYSTLEPCVHHGRTGPCTERIIAAGIKRVVAALEDPFPQVQGRGFARLRAHGIAVDVGIERDAALRLNQPFLTTVRLGRPFVILKAATSLDGRIAAAPGVRTSLTAPIAGRHVQYTRAGVDAIAVGAGTILIDDPILTARDLYRERPFSRVIFDRRLQTPPSARIFSTLADGPVIIVTTAQSVSREAHVAALAAAGATVVPVAGGTMSAALQALVPFNIQSILLEGGAAVHAAAWDEDLVDYVQLYVAPVVLGPRGVPFLEGRTFSATRLLNTKVRVLGPDILTEGYVHRPC